MADEETTFGQALYDELKRLGGGVTSNLKYADIQRLKAADREAVVDLFRGSGYAVIQRIKNIDSVYDAYRTVPGGDRQVDRT